LSAGIAALEKGADVTIYEKADKKMAGGKQSIQLVQCDFPMIIVIS
jgi:hypothetical protein